MGTEIERKFLVLGDAWRTAPEVLYRQGYLNSAKERVVRVRIIGDKGFLTIKGINVGAIRSEFEYEFLSPTPANYWTPYAKNRSSRKSATPSNMAG